MTSSPSTQIVETSVTTNNSPSHDYTNPTQWLWRWLPHRLSKRQSQPTTVLLTTTQTRHNDSEHDFHPGCRNVSHNQQSPSQNYTNPTQWLCRWLPHRLSKCQSQPTKSLSELHKPDPMTVKMTSTHVVEMSVTTNKVCLRTTQTRTINQSQTCLLYLLRFCLLCKTTWGWGLRAARSVVHGRGCTSHDWSSAQRSNSFPASMPHHTASCHSTCVYTRTFPPFYPDLWRRRLCSHPSTCGSNIYRCSCTSFWNLWPEDSSKLSLKK